MTATKDELLRSADEFDAKADKNEATARLLVEHGGEPEPFLTESAANYRKAAQELRTEAAQLAS